MATMKKIRSPRVCKTPVQKGRDLNVNEKENIKEVRENDKEFEPKESVSHCAEIKKKMATMKKIRGFCKTPVQKGRDLNVNLKENIKEVRENDKEPEPDLKTKAHTPDLNELKIKALTSLSFKKDINKRPVETTSDFHDKNLSQGKAIKNNNIEIIEIPEKCNN